MTDCCKKVCAALPLTRLPCGACARVVRIDKSVGSIWQRLRELGFCESETVECVGESPFGGMRAYRVLQSIIALRDTDAEAVEVSYGEA